MNILITGASRGIGYDTAIELAKNKTHTIIACSRNNNGLAYLKEAGAGQIDTYTIDITTATDEKINSILDKYTQIDVLINNAGILINKPFTSTSKADWEKIFNTNVFATANLIRLTIPYMQKNDISHIINVGSMGGVQGTSKFNGLSAYSASKAALANLTECLAEELTEYNIRVNCLALGAVNTAMLNDAFPEYEAPMSSKEIAKYIADFSTNGYKFVNGKILPIALTTP